MPPDDLQDFERDAGPGTGQRSDQAEGSIAKGTDWLGMPEPDAAKRAIKLWEDQHRHMKSRLAQWKANRARREGIANVMIVKDRDTKEVTVWIPPGPQVPVLNKADRLCRRVRSFLFSDPPMAEATPARDDDEARDAAEFSTRALQDLGSEGTLDDALTAAQAFDGASTYDSGFRRYFIDPTGGGKRPVEIVANAEIATLPEALQNPGPEPHVTRYANLAGQLVDDANAPNLRMQWIPKLRVEVLTGKHVRFLPHTSRDIWAAEGALVGTMTTLGQLRAAFPVRFAQLTEDDRKQLISDRPQGWKELLPKSDRRFEVNEGQEDDEQAVFTLTLYYKAKPIPGREKGVYLVAAGKGVLLYRGPWEDPQHPDNVLDIPIDQFKQFDDEDESYGKGLMRLLGPGNELRNAQVGTFLEHLDRFINRKVFYPATSTWQPKSARAATATHIPINPGGQPHYEEVPDFPKMAEKMLDFVNADMDDESALQQIAQGVNPPSVKSGLHAQEIVEQVIAALSDIRTNTIRALIRGWRIQLQLVRAFYSVPQRLAWVGEDGAYKERMWTGADLGGTKDVRLQRGTFTSLTPTAKAAVAEHLFALVDPQTGRPLIPADELERIALAQVGGQLGLQDNPHRLRVRRQIDRWRDGPPEGWQPPEPQVDPATGQPAVDPQTGQPLPPPPDPALQAIFDPRPVDDLPDVAAVRLTELARLMSSMRFGKWPPEWQRGVMEEFERARQAAGVQTAQEAAEGAQAQIQAETDAKLQEKQLDTEGKVKVAEITSGGEIEEERIRAATAGQPNIDLNIQAGGGA